MSEPADEWVTVAEAAVRLEVDARQVRRWTARLSPKDRSTDTQRTHKGQPVSLVRLSAVEEVRDQSRVAVSSAEDRDEPTDQTRTIRNGQSQRTRKGQSKGQPDLSLEDWRTRAAVAEAQVAELRERVAVAETALQREQENTRAALAQLADSDARLASVLAATGRVQIPAQNALESPTRGDGTPNRESADGGSVSATAAEAPARPWWRWWR